MLEGELESAYGLRESHVYDIGEPSDEASLLGELGQLLALHLQNTSVDADVIRFTSWSRTLQETVRSLRPLRQFRATFVVEMLGDIGPPLLQHQTAQHTQQLADMVGAKPMFLRLPESWPAHRSGRHC